MNKMKQLIMMGLALLAVGSFAIGTSENRTEALKPKARS